MLVIAATALLGCALANESTVPTANEPAVSTEVADVARSADSVQQGRQVYETIAGIGCKACHGDFAEGDLGVGPYIRGATEGSIRAAVDGIGEMVAVKMIIRDEEIAAVTNYLAYLGDMQVARTLSKRGRFLPQETFVRPGTLVQVVIKNSGVSPASYQSDNMQIEPITISGRSTGSIEWQAPVQQGEYSLYCADCKLQGESFVIKVDENAPAPPGAMTTAAVTPASDGM